MAAAPRRGWRAVSGSQATRADSYDARRGAARTGRAALPPGPGCRGVLCGDRAPRVSYLGHKSIQHTVRYSELAATRSKSLFRE